MVLLALVGSCAGKTPGAEPTVAPAELFCNEDDDCQILDRSIPFDCCEDSHETEPYAIARVVLGRRAADRAARCAGVLCEDPLIRYRTGPFCRTRTEEWTAVCARHLCIRRSVHVLLPEKTVGCDSKE